MENTMLISKEMTIDDILSSYPSKSQKLAMEMASIGLQCVGCGASTWETLEAGMLGHGMQEEEIEKLVTKLNQIILQEEADPGTITMTARAVEKFKEILADEGKSGWALRFGDRPGGCSGYEYTLDFSEKKEPEDEVFAHHGIEIHVHRSMVDRLLGSEIDYMEGLRHSGFKVTNPNVRGSCGCGNSQTY